MAPTSILVKDPGPLGLADMFAIMVESTHSWALFPAPLLLSPPEAAGKGTRGLQGVSGVSDLRSWKGTRPTP